MVKTWQKSRTGVLSFSLLLSLLGIRAEAALTKATPPPTPRKILEGKGSIMGGVSGKGFSLLDLRKTGDVKNKIERLVFDVGDLQGRKKKGLPGYYHVQIMQNPPRLILDFAQMPASKINAQEIQKRLNPSIFIQSSQLSLDPVDNTLSLVFFLKNKARAQVYQVAGEKNTSKVVIDLIQ